MTTPIRTIFSISRARALSAAALAGGALLAGTHDSSSLQAVPRGAADCGQVASIALQSSLTQAQADLWLELAKCVNEGGNLATCLAELREEYRAALEIAREQHAAKEAVCQMLGGGSYAPELEPSEFTSTVTNRYFPLVPGRTLVYEKRTDEGVETIRVTVERRTVEIDGIECAVVRDIVDLDGEVIEDTEDWFAQHRSGDVWYIGEIAENYEEGLLDNLDGSWRSGKDGARAGISMKASPRIGDFYRQEYLINEAEDVALVLALGKTVAVPAGTFANCLQTEDSSALEPGAREHKFYAPGIGLVLEVNPESGARTELVRILGS
jgi:hypothetical protein